MYHRTKAFRRIGACHWFVGRKIESLQAYGEIPCAIGMPFFVMRFVCVCSECAFRLALSIFIIPRLGVGRALELDPNDKEAADMIGELNRWQS